MKKQMFFTLTALALTAGSIFAYANLSETESVAKKNCIEKCLPNCCDDDCGPTDCKK